MPNPIPPRLLSRFRSRMAAANDDDLEAGAWFRTMADVASAFMREHQIRGNPDDAIAQYLELEMAESE